MPEDRSWRVIGPLHGRINQDGKPRFGGEANARLILHRTAVAVAGGGKFELKDEPVLTWAVETNLGQKRRDSLRADLAARRAAALQLLASTMNQQAVVVEIEPQAALVTGTGAGGIRNVGIELHGTHGWPIIPATGLKGVAAAYTEDVESREVVERIFGGPRPGRDDDEALAKPGSVLFFDALPGPGGVTVAQHDLTPHTREYHTGSESDGSRPAPAEHLNPVPIPFLVVDGGTFIAHLVGPAADVAIAARLQRAALDDIGVGAKTSAGYGYLTATVIP